MKNFICINNPNDMLASISEQIGEWVKSDQLREIVNSFGGKIPHTNDMGVLVDWLLEFSDIWDYRNQQKRTSADKALGLERWSIISDGITDKQARIVLDSIKDLGLTGVKYPMHKTYDYIVALGGARLSCLLRPKYANHIIKNIPLEPKSVVMLSGLRLISDIERETTDTYAPGAVSEFDLINRGAALAFGVNDYQEDRYDDPTNINSSWIIRTYKKEKLGFPLLSIAAPSREPDKRRANSVDTYRFFAQRCNLKPGDRILFITNQIYVPYQQLEAIRILAIPYGVIAETIGIPNEWTGPGLATRDAGKYLQEIRSTIQAISRLLQGYCSMI